jgi:hypothetical protein
MPPRQLLRTRGDRLVDPNKGREMNSRYGTGMIVTEEM